MQARLSVLILLIVCGLQAAWAQNQSNDSASLPSLEDFKKENTFDSTANALVLSEIGDAAIRESGDNFELQYEYRVRIKILNERGLSAANVSLYLIRNGESKESITDVEASSFCIKNGAIVQQKLDTKKVYSTKENEYYNLFSFAIPNVQVGGIIEYRYILHSPFYYRDFHKWLFQTDFPKIISKYTVHIPAYLDYKASLRGSLKLSHQTASIETECLTVNGLGRVDCSKLSWEMKNIPAFRKEKYTNQCTDYQSKIEFELVSATNGRYYNRKYTQSWKDVDINLKTDPKFGGAIRRAASFFRHILDTMLRAGMSDSVKAVKIYKLVRLQLNWDRAYSTTQIISGPPKLWSTRKGTSGDLNLALIAALRAGGLNANPMLIVTRSNGSPRKIFPVVSDFNTVIAVLDLRGRRYFLDITDKHMPFGLLPEEFLSHEGRLFIQGDSSRWAPIKLSFNSKLTSVFNLVLGKDGSLKGSLDEYGMGYNAFWMNEEYARYATEDDYLDAKAKTLPNTRILSYKRDSLNDEYNTHETFGIEINNYHKQENGRAYFSAFLSPIWNMNGVFNTKVRLFPFDIAYPIAKTVVVSISIPAGYTVISEPPETRLRLADQSATFNFIHATDQNTYKFSYGISLLKPVYTIEEFYDLKEIFARIAKLKRTLISLQL